MQWENAEILQYVSGNRTLRILDLIRITRVPMSFEMELWKYMQL